MKKMILTAAFAGAVMFLAAGCCCTKAECEKDTACNAAAVCCTCGENCKCTDCKCAKGEKCECSKECKSCKETAACPAK